MGGGVGLENVRLSDESAEVAVVVAGYIGLKMSERSNCDDCQCSLIRFTAREETQEEHEATRGLPVCVSEELLDSSSGMDEWNYDFFSILATRGDRR